MSGHASKYSNFIARLLQTRTRATMRVTKSRKTSDRLSETVSIIVRHAVMPTSAGMRIMIVTDAWFPQTNGVVRTLSQTAAWLGRFGHEVRDADAPATSAASPARPIRRSGCRCGRDPTVRAHDPRTSTPQALHIATEGPLGLAARRYCLRQRHALHDVVPHPVSAVPARPLSDSAIRFSYGLLRWFHGAAVRCMVSTALRAQGARGARLRESGGLAPRRRHRVVQAADPRTSCSCRARSPPTSAGSRSRRTSRRSCKMPWTGSKIVIGDGPERARLQSQYPERGVHRLPLRRGPRRASRGGRRHGVSEPHRHLRAGESGGHGLRRARRGLSGHRPDRRHRGRRDRRAGRGSGQARRCAPSPSTRRPAARTPCAAAGRRARANSRETWWPAARTRGRSAAPGRWSRVRAGLPTRRPASAAADRSRPAVSRS